MEIKARHSWGESFGLLIDPRVLRMLFLGFSAGLPILLIFSSLSLWLGEAGVEKSAVTFFSWAALGYSFKFVWAPLVDRLPLPFLTRTLGRRRAWLLVAQCLIMVAIAWMGLTNPASGEGQLTMMALAAVMLGFSSATQDIVIDAYRIEAGDSDLQAMMSSAYIAGYRIGMLIAGAGALVLAGYFGSTSEHYVYEAWRNAYLIMASVMLVGVLTTLVIPEPKVNRKLDDHSTRDYLGFVGVFVVAIAGFILTFAFSAEVFVQIKSGFVSLLGSKVLAGFLGEALRLGVSVTVALSIARFLIAQGAVNKSMLDETYIDPVKDFFSRFGLKTALLLLALIGFYRISDIVLGIISNVFFQDMGFTKFEIASVVKTFGLFMTLAGGLLGGILAMRYGVMRILLLGGVLVVVTNLLFVLLAQAGHDITLLYLVISADNLSAGIASAAFIAFLSSLTNISFTAMQYAIFSSLMTMFPKLLGGYSGSMVEVMGYSNFFLVASVMGLPVLVLILMARRRFR